jgi:hypothetical protein
MSYIYHALRRPQSLTFLLPLDQRLLSSFLLHVPSNTSLDLVIGGSLTLHPPNITCLRRLIIQIHQSLNIDPWGFPTCMEDVMDEAAPI